MTTYDATAPRRSRAGAAAVLLPVAGTVASVGVWWLAILVFNIQPYILPTPAAVVAAFRRLPVYLLEQTWVTFTEVLQGYSLSVAAGLVLAIAIASSRVVEQMLYPPLLALNAIPKVALGPLLVVWLGLNQWPKVVMVFLVCFFPIVIAAATGLMSTPSELAEYARSLSATRRQMFVKVRFPSALPQIFVGLKVAMPLAVIGAAIGEQNASDAGLMFVVLQASGIADTALAFAAILLLAALGVALFYVLVGVERLLLPWVRETTSAR